MADVKRIHDEVKELFGLVPTWVKEMPESAVTGFWTMMRDFQLAETRIPNKYKELIGLAVAGATRCRYCALFHTEAARMFGATDDELAEASMMGAATMAGSTFLNAQQTDYDTFSRELHEMLEYVRAHKPAATASTTQQQPPMQH
ncbi:carboxymuconolactone decarboxylase family protein [Anaeromyxobacter sp. Fw109-5]|uniref:carboxymuconolactone decarboxylase family protein n=1 Tax=Anaeromyxobacter sp. (strain Fw109-5) TaxID=404589 RepID=UPI0000ED6F13|nr:carboxymuconolactone decarboxylase family protein [Anaeromyxobacter sp. Fw109-5]ABS28478.1 alkylhydroperoxidase like protein, AhpD family [Anaeromyxobacter sp. Fw109-5]